MFIVSAGEKKVSTVVDTMGCIVNHGGIEFPSYDPRFAVYVLAIGYMCNYSYLRAAGNRSMLVENSCILVVFARTKDKRIHNPVRFFTNHRAPYPRDGITYQIIESRDWMF